MCQSNAAMFLVLVLSALGALFGIVQGGWLCGPGALLTYLWKNQNCAGGGNNRPSDRSGGINAASPCPSVFRYEWDGVEWYGIITAPSIPYGTPARLVARLSIGRALPTKYAGSLELIGIRADILQAMLREQPIQYRVNFPLPQPLPIVTMITLNERIICSGPPVAAPVVTSIVLEHMLYPHGQPLNSEDTRFNRGSTSQQPPVDSTPEVRNFTNDAPVGPSTMNVIEKGVYEEVCGRPVAVRPLVANGEVTQRGSYPWLAAIFAQKSLGLEFTCGGTLITARFVITAAHCIRYGENRALSTEEVLVVLGKYQIRRWTEEGSVVREARSIILHPEYRALSGDADLACIELSSPVRFTDTIRPVCIWPSLIKSLQELVGRQATIVGWGRDESGNKITPEPRQTQVRVVSQEDCLRSRLEFRYITSNRTLCAGGVQPGSGPCSGDSGGGMFLRGEDGRWYLRGVVSMSLADPKTKSCDLDHFSVFVDMAKFTDWLAQFLR